MRWRFRWVQSGAALVMFFLPSLVGAEPLYFACRSCHGDVAQGIVAKQAPPLTNLSEAYIVRQMQAFKKGWRGGQEGDVLGQHMALIAAAYSDDQIARIAKYISSLPQNSPSEKTQKIVELQPLYEACASCHGDHGQGNSEMQGPALHQFSEEYLVLQLRNYRQGLRGGHPEDELGQIMRTTVEYLSLDDAQIRALARAIAD